MTQSARYCLAHKFNIQCDRIILKSGAVSATSQTIRSISTTVRLLAWNIFIHIFNTIRGVSCRRLPIRATWLASPLHHENDQYSFQSNVPNLFLRLVLHTWPSVWSRTLVELRHASSTEASCLHRQNMTKLHPVYSSWRVLCAVAHVGFASALHISRETDCTVACLMRFLSKALSTHGCVFRGQASCGMGSSRSFAWGLRYLQ